MRPIFNTDEVVAPDAEPAMIWQALASTAVANRVSDIHAAAQEDGYEVAFRLDGELRPQGRLTGEFGRRLIGHVKSVSGIDLAETRRPTEGRMKLRMNGRTLDLRISIVPTLHGQDMVVRIFDGTVSLFELTELGLYDEQLQVVKDVISRPSGLILVTGPSGGGKTTTLYAIIRELAARGVKIITIEDPVECDLAGANQTQVNPRLDVTFARMLTAILRQDPDVIMVGEIRDRETAVTAVRAANTGHLVIATAHATRASRAVEAMLSLGVHPYFLSAALRCVIAQVLVKKICKYCKTSLPETVNILVDEVVAERLPKGTKPQLYQGKGCGKCFGSGYSGRRGLFEVFSADEHVRELILRREPADAIDSAAAASGMLTLEQAGKLAAVTGETTMEEVVDMLPTLQ